jgi:DNA-binding HxlR family transcriptional regulator
MENIRCDVLKLLQLLGKKWSIQILYMIDKPISYNEIKANCENKINPTLLSSRLKSFIKLNLIERKIISEKVIYIITLSGTRLKNIISQDLKNWAIESNLKVPNNSPINSYNPLE